MVTIITGGINSGKTAKMIELYYRGGVGAGDGFVSAKIFRDNAFIGYEINRLSKSERMTLALLKNVYKAEFAESFAFGQFIFSVEGFRAGEKILRELIDDTGIRDIYLDEIGPMELAGKGFSEAFRAVLGCGKNVTVCIRNGCLQAVIKEFRLAPFNLIQI